MMNNGVTFDCTDHVAVLVLNDGENRFNPPFLKGFLDVLDAIETDTDARTLVVRSAHETIFSNGIDLEWLIPVIESGDPDTARAFFYTLNRLYKRVLTYPLVTVAAITGHAFAAGAILCCAFDFRFMRSGRGFFCLPEVDLGIPFLPGMNALLKKAMPMHLLEEMQLTGIRLTAEDCEIHRLVRKACPEASLLSETLDFAESLKKERAVVAELKKRLYRPIVHALDVEDVPYIEARQFAISSS